MDESSRRLFVSLIQEAGNDESVKVRVSREPIVVTPTSVCARKRSRRSPFSTKASPEATWVVRDAVHSNEVDLLVYGLTGAPCD
jgi:hypothetical protein